MVTREEYARLSPAQKAGIATLSGLCEGACENCPFKTEFGAIEEHTYKRPNNPLYNLLFNPALP